MASPNPALGEVGIVINGEPQVIRMHMEAQEKIANDLDLEDISKIAKGILIFDLKTISVFIQHSLVSTKMSREEVSKAHIPRNQAMNALCSCVNLAMFGDANPPEDTEDPPEVKGEAMSIQA